MTWYLIALGVWGVGLFIRYRVDRSMLRYALEAIAEDEDAAAAAGVHVTWEKLKITLLSAAMTAFAGALYCQYQMFISPDTVSGISVSLQMVFAAVVGGIYVLLGPTVGAFITILLAEVLRVGFGAGAVGWDNIIYGTLLVVFIIFLPQGLVGSLQARFTRVRVQLQADPDSVANIYASSRCVREGRRLDCQRNEGGDDPRPGVSHQPVNTAVGITMKTPINTLRNYAMEVATWLRGEGPVTHLQQQPS